MPLNRIKDTWRRWTWPAAALVLLATGLAAAYPVPASIPFRWEFKFEPGALRLYVESESGQSYWYMTYKVTNRTGRDRIWAPKFTLFTDAGEILESGKNVPTDITNEILDLLRSRFLETQNDVIGDLLEGPENAREGLVVWPARVLNVNELSVFIAGISGETTRVRNPMEPNEQIILYKTLQRDYLIPGDALARGTTPVDLVQERWIFR